MEQPTLHTERLILRPFRVTDAPDVQRLAGRQEIASTTLRIPHPYEDGMAEEWIRGLPGARDRGESVVFAVTDRETGGLIGDVGLRLELEHRRAEMGFWIGLPHWDRGYATEAAAAVLGYAFQSLGLNRVQATHMTRNPASGRVLEKIGMTYEGRLRQYVRKAGTYENLELYAILREDWSSG